MNSVEVSVQAGKVEVGRLCFCAVGVNHWYSRSGAQEQPHSRQQMVRVHHTLPQLVAPVLIVLVAIIRPIVCYSSAIDIGSKWHPEPSYTCSTRNGWLPLFSLTGLLYTMLLQTVVDETSARFRSSYETVSSRDGQSSYKLDGVRLLVRPSVREAVGVLGFLTFLITSELPRRARATRAERDASCACCRRQGHHP